MRPLIATLLLLVVWVALVVTLIVAGRKTAGRELALLLPNLVRLFRGLFSDPRVPLGSKLLVGLAIVWIASPVDLLPEFLPVIGPLDDAIVAALVLRHLVRRAGEDVIRDHWRGDPRTLSIVLRVAGYRARRAPEPTHPAVRRPRLPG
jgi:uncharacterized membrane protein YkvA (DUF1232 family)